MLECIYWLYLIQAHTWERLQWYPTRAHCEVVARDLNAPIVRTPGQIGPTWICRAVNCGPFE